MKTSEVKKTDSFNRISSIQKFLASERKSLFILLIILLLVCLYDLFSYPLATTIWRQAQTALITENFAKANFSFNGLHVGLNGNERFLMVYEFPLYNFIVGIFFKVFNTNAFWGKFISLLASTVTVVVFYKLVKSISDSSIAFFASLFLILTPIAILMFTAFQPDALSVMFMMIALLVLNNWRSDYSIRQLALCSVCLLLCGLCKFPILVPYIPIFVLIYFFPEGKFRFPALSELALLFILFLLPFVTWYLYRTYLSDPTLRGGESKMFFLGDLSRFLSLSYYWRPGGMYIIMVWCVTGAIYFFGGLRKTTIIERSLLLGMPLYYIIIPTSADQAYYTYPLVPIVAIFMAKGAISICIYLKQRRLNALNYLLAASFCLFSLFGASHVLRQDEVMIPLANAVAQVTKPDDLIFGINMHDRSVWVGGLNPEVQYFTKRQGWNIQNFNAHDFENTFSEIDSKRKLGAKWVLITWYTPSLETWYSIYLPKQFSRAPVFDSKQVADKLKQHYRVKVDGNNFAILAL